MGGSLRITNCTKLRTYEYRGMSSQFLSTKTTRKDGKNCFGERRIVIKAFFTCAII